MLQDNVLYCTVLHYTVLYCTVLHYTTLYCTVLHYTVLCYAMPCLTAQFNTILCYTTQYYTKTRLTRFRSPKVCRCSASKSTHTGVANKRGALILRDWLVGPANIGPTNLWRWGLEKPQFSKSWQQCFPRQPMCYSTYLTENTKSSNNSSHATRAWLTKSLTHTKGITEDYTGATGSFCDVSRA
jgi:hypothetical protein